MPKKTRISTMNVSLPITQADYVRQRVQAAGYGSVSDYIRELIRQDQQAQTEGQRALALFAHLGKGFSASESMGSNVGEPPPAYKQTSSEGINSDIGFDKKSAAAALRSVWELYKFGMAMASQRHSRDPSGKKDDGKDIPSDYLVVANDRLKKILND